MFKTNKGTKALQVNPFVGMHRDLKIRKRYSATNRGGSNYVYMEFNRSSRRSYNNYILGFVSVGVRICLRKVRRTL